jgi:hypothetical protein
MSGLALDTVACGTVAAIHAEFAGSSRSSSTFGHVFNFRATYALTGHFPDWAFDQSCKAASTLLTWFIGFRLLYS